MVRVAIENLEEEKEISDEEMKAVLGGLKRRKLGRTQQYSGDTYNQGRQGESLGRAYEPPDLDASARSAHTLP